MASGEWFAVGVGVSCVELLKLISDDMALDRRFDESVDRNDDECGNRPVAEVNGDDDDGEW